MVTTSKARGMKLEGDRQLIRALGRIPIKLRTDVLVAALDEGAKIIQRAAATGAPRDREVLADSIERHKLPGKFPAVAIRPSYGKAPHAHLVEFGTGPRMSSRGFRGIMPAQPFMGPAYRRNVGRANKVIGALVLKSVERIARQEGRRG